MHFSCQVHAKSSFILISLHDISCKKKKKVDLNFVNLENNTNSYMFMYL